MAIIGRLVEHTGKAKQFAAATSIENADLSPYGVFQMTAAGVLLTFPDAGYFYLGQKITVRGHSSGYSAVVLGTGVSDEVVVIPPNEDVDIMCVEFSAGYKWISLKKHDMVELSWSPTLTFSTATPTLSASSYEAYWVNGLILGILDIQSANGKNASALTVTLPTRPKDRDNFVPVVGQVIVDSVASNPQAYIESANGTAANRLLTFQNWATLTTAKAFSLHLAFFYEPAAEAWETFSSGYAFGTSTWASVTEVSRCKVINRTQFFTSDLRSTDAKGVTSSVTISTPAVVPDQDIYYAVTALNKATAGDDSVDYTDMLMLLDSANATETSRVAVGHAVGVMANGKAAEAYIAGFCGTEGGKGLVAFTPTATFAGGTSAVTATASGLGTMLGGCFFYTLLVSTTDGNGATSLVISDMPVPPKYKASRKIAAEALQLVTSTYTRALGIVNADQEAVADRTITFNGIGSTPFTNAATSLMVVTGWYPVESQAA
jgi:hypothetical protein